jgi:hypothetical protein
MLVNPRRSIKVTFARLRSVNSGKSDARRKAWELKPLSRN